MKVPLLGLRSPQGGLKHNKVWKPLAKEIQIRIHNEKYPTPSKVAKIKKGWQHWMLLMTQSNWNFHTHWLWEYKMVQKAFVKGPDSVL